MTNNKNQYKFTEGEIHQFKINGFAEMPGTDESFYILENRFGGKHLLKSFHYKHYNFNKGEEITCKIDKINCSGKIYLEPENPVYKEGKSYEFDLMKIIDQINSVGEKEKAAILKDQFRIEVVCSLPENVIIDSSANKLECKVLRIKKGQLYLIHPLADLAQKRLNIGEKHWFTVTEVKELENRINYYILKDNFGNTYSLKKDMYEQYGFQIGEKIECTVTKFNTDAHLKIEPVHPHYEIGKKYSFKYLRTTNDLDPLGKEEKVIIVEDIYGVETKVRSRNISNLKEPYPEYLNCMVDGIRKGKAILSLI